MKKIKLHFMLSINVMFANLFLVVKMNETLFI